MRRARPSRRGGLTMVELLLAVGLASILMVAVFRLLDVSLDLWSKGETRRAAIEQASGVGRLLADDLRALHGGQGGDLLVEWVRFDTDGDGIGERVLPRLRLVRLAAGAELARLFDREHGERFGAGEDRGATAAERPAPVRPPTALVEVAWAVLPAGGEEGRREQGVLYRAERLAGGAGASLFDPAAFEPSGWPRSAELFEVSDGILWFGVRLATRASLVREEWRAGPGPAEVATSWDAYGAGRPDPEAHFWNEPSAGLPPAAATPALPRRVRVEVEYEPARELRRRPRLVDGLDAVETRLRVGNGDLLPRAPDLHVLVGAEWMLVRGVEGDVLTVERAARGTRPELHPAGARVHFGERVVTEVPVAQHDDDWRM